MFAFFPNYSEKLHFFDRLKTIIETVIRYEIYGFKKEYIIFLHRWISESTNYKLSLVKYLKPTAQRGIACHPQPYNHHRSPLFLVRSQNNDKSDS